MHLPNLAAYRLQFLQKNVQVPLSTLEVPPDGLLSRLPGGDSGRQGWPWNLQTDPLLYRATTSWPKISIVTPSFNQAEFLEETIRSVLLQNYPNLEYIVIDGGSTDRSPAILKKYAPWISYYQSEKDEGQAQAINYGFSLATGKYLAWINSDDHYLPDVFHLISRAFDRTGADFLYGYSYDQDVQTGKSKLVRVMPVIDYLIKMPNLSQPSTFWRATIHQPLWEVLQCAIDYELWLRLVKGNRKKLLKVPLSVAKIHPDAKTSDPAMLKKWDDDNRIMWSSEGHGPVPEWNRLVFIHRIRSKIFRYFNI